MASRNIPFGGYLRNPLTLLIPLGLAAAAIFALNNYAKAKKAPVDPMAPTRGGGRGSWGAKTELVSDDGTGWEYFNYQNDDVAPGEMDEFGMDYNTIWQLNTASRGNTMSRFRGPQVMNAYYGDISNYGY